MAEIKNEKIGKKKTGQGNREHKTLGDNSLLIGIGIGAILLVLAEILCVFGEIYYMLSDTRSIVVITISTLLLLGITGIFFYITKNILLKKMEEQRQADERLIRMNKVAYGKMEERDEKLYKRQLSIAKSQIKRTRESVMNMVRANEYIIDVIEEKLGEDSVLSAYGEALQEVQESVAQLRELCEKIAEGQAEGPVPEILPESTVEMPELTEEVPEVAEEAPEPEEVPEVTEEIPEPEEALEITEEVPEPEEEILEPEEPEGVEIEPLPEEVLNRMSESEMDAMLDELVSEPEINLEEFLPEPAEPEELPEADAPEIVESPVMETEEEKDTDTGQPMSMEDIAALFNNL